MYPGKSENNLRQRLDSGFIWERVNTSVWLEVLKGAMGSKAGK